MTDDSTPQPALSPPETEDWRSSMPDDLRRAADKFASPVDALRSYVALERRLGRSVTVPGSDAGPVELDAYYARLGRPDSPDGYRITVPEGVPQHLADGEADSERRADFLRAMHKAGATPAVVQAAADWFYRHAAEVDRANRDTQAEAQSRAHREAEAGMRREWGAEYDRRLEHARRAAHLFGGAALSRLMDETGLGNHPAWLRAFARIGAEMAEDAVLSGIAVDDARSAQERIDAIMSAHFGKPSYGAAAVQDELRALYEAIYGAGPARPDAA